MGNKASKYGDGKGQISRTDMINLTCVSNLPSRPQAVRLLETYLDPTVLALDASQDDACLYRIPFKLANPGAYKGLIAFGITAVVFLIISLLIFIKFEHYHRGRRNVINSLWKMRPQHMHRGIERLYNDEVIPFANGGHRKSNEKRPIVRFAVGTFVNDFPGLKRIITVKEDMAHLTKWDSDYARAAQETRERERLYGPLRPLGPEPLRRPDAIRHPETLQRNEPFSRPEPLRRPAPPPAYAPPPAPAPIYMPAQPQPQSQVPVQVRPRPPTNLRAPHFIYNSNYRSNINRRANSNPPSNPNPPSNDNSPSSPPSPSNPNSNFNPNLNPNNPPPHSRAAQNVSQIETQRGLRKTTDANQDTLNCEQRLHLEPSRVERERQYRQVQDVGERVDWEIHNRDRERIVLERGRIERERMRELVQATGNADVIATAVPLDWRTAGLSEREGEDLLIAGAMVMGGAGIVVPQGGEGTGAGVGGSAGTGNANGNASGNGFAGPVQGAQVVEQQGGPSRRESLGTPPPYVKEA